MKKSFFICLIITAVILLSSVLSGCGKIWIPERRAETDIERALVAEHVREILSKTPSTLSGRDQDWDDSIRGAHHVALDTYCKTRLYEWDASRNSYTGKVMELSAAENQITK